MVSIAAEAITVLLMLVLNLTLALTAAFLELNPFLEPMDFKGAIAEVTDVKAGDVLEAEVDDVSWEA